MSLVYTETFHVKRNACDDDSPPDSSCRVFVPTLPANDLSSPLQDGAWSFCGLWLLWKVPGVAVGYALFSFLEDFCNGTPSFILQRVERVFQIT